MADANWGENCRETWIDTPDGQLRGVLIHPERDSYTALVFLHHALGGIAQWRGFPKRLCAALGRPGLVFERAGSGRSDPLPGPRGSDYLHRQADAVLPPVLAHTGWERPLLVGHSDGGSIALLYAAQRQGHVAGVVSIAAHVHVDRRTLAGIRSTIEAYQSPDSRLRSGLERHHGDKTDTLFRAWADTWLAEDFAGWDIRAVLSTVADPVLVIQGEDDPFAEPGQVKAIEAGVSGPVEGHLLPGVGHDPHLEASERIVGLITDWLPTGA